MPLSGDQMPILTGVLTSILDSQGNPIINLVAPINPGDAANKAYVDSRGSSVTSVFGRTGAVVAATSDYNFNQLAGTATTTQGGVPTGGTTGQFLKKNSATNYDTIWATLPTSAATLQTTTVNPLGTTSPSGAVMMGLGGGSSPAVITPLRTGRIFLSANGCITASLAGHYSTVALRYGTGTAPANGASITGTGVGGLVQSYPPAAIQTELFCLTAVVTGLAVTPATPVWIDVTLQSDNSSVTATISNVTVCALEF